MASKVSSAASSMHGKTTPKTIAKKTPATAAMPLGEQRKKLLLGKIEKLERRSMANDKEADSLKEAKPSVPNAWGTKPNASIVSIGSSVAQAIGKVQIDSRPSSVVSKTGRGVVLSTPNASSWRARSTMQGRASSIRSIYGSNVHSQYTGGSIYEKGRPTDMFHDSSEYREGVVFSTTTHEHHYNQNFHDKNKPDQSVTRLGIVNSKYRKFVVVARFAKHVVALPIYTHGGNGLERTSDKHEHISVRDAEMEGQCAKGETEHGILWHDLYPRFLTTTGTSYHYMNDKTSIHFTYPYAHRTDKRCTISGELVPESTDRLLDLFKDALDDNNVTPIATEQRSRKF